MTIINLNTIKKKLNEDFSKAPLPSQAGHAKPQSFKSGKGDVAPNPKYDKTKGKARTKPKLQPKLSINKSKNSGPDKAPSSQKIPAKNTAKTASAPKPDLKVSPKGSTKSHFVDAKDVKRTDATPVKWTAASGSSTDKLLGTCLQGCDPSSVKKITFSVKKPTNVDYGIVPTGQVYKTSQSHKWKNVANPSKGLSESVKRKGPVLVSEGVINGTVVVKVGQRTHVFEAASTKMINKLAKNYGSVGQAVSIDVRHGFRNSYSDRKFVSSIMEAVHAKTLDVNVTYKEKLKESYKRFVKLIENQYVPFHHKSKQLWLNECVKPAFKQAFTDFSNIYESFLSPFEVTVKARTKNGLELFDVVTRGLNESVAAFNASEEVISEAGISTKIERIYIGSTTYLYEDVKSVHTKALSFDDMPEGFENAGFGTKVNTTRINPSAPSYNKQGAVSKTRPQGVKVVSPKAKVGNPESLVDRTGTRKPDQHGKKVQVKKDSGPKFPE